MKLFLFLTLLVLNGYKDFQSEAYPEPCQIFKIKIFAVITIFEKNSFLDVFPSCE